MNDHELTESLAGANIVLKISDPWELGEAIKWEPLSGVVLQEKVGDDGTIISLVVQLRNSFKYNDTTCEMLVACPRHEGSDYGPLKKGESVFSGLTCISTDRYSKSEDPFDLSWWRGGLALIGNISVLRE
jgi:hypothetical protein